METSGAEWRGVVLCVIANAWPKPRHSAPLHPSPELATMRSVHSPESDNVKMKYFGGLLEHVIKESETAGY